MWSKELNEKYSHNTFYSNICFFGLKDSKSPLWDTEIRVLSIIEALRTSLLDFSSSSIDFDNVVKVKIITRSEWGKCYLIEREKLHGRLYDDQRGWLRYILRSGN